MNNFTPGDGTYANAKGARAAAKKKGYNPAHVAIGETPDGRFYWQHGSTDSRALAGQSDTASEPVAAPAAPVTAPPSAEPVPPVASDPDMDQAIADDFPPRGNSLWEIEARAPRRSEFEDVCAWATSFCAHHMGKSSRKAVIAMLVDEGVNYNTARLMWQRARENAMLDRWRGLLS